MLKRSRISLLAVLLGAILLSTPALTQEPVARVVIFYSPSCGHCHQVMTEVLPPLQEQYGDQLEVLEINTFEDEGLALYQAATEKYQPRLRGVPLLIIGDYALVGSQEIPEQLPGLIEQYLAEGGVAWPDLPGLPATEEVEDPDWRDRYMRDPVGNTFSVIVLVGLIGSLVAVAQPHHWQWQWAERFRPWGFVIVTVVGLVAASYLSFVEVTQTTAVCGPVGDCNAVQQSEFAMLFGFFPIAVLGLMGYLVILATFAYGYWAKDHLADRAPAATFLLAAFGVVVSAVLTFLEPFVIGATCLWCLTSAVSMALLLLLSAGPGWTALGKKPPRKRRSRRGRR
ncbi:MAG: vitamin K epoxide reductase family protein [Anaerolineae bacterium]